MRSETEIRAMMARSRNLTERMFVLMQEFTAAGGVPPQVAEFYDKLQVIAPTLWWTLGKKLDPSDLAYHQETIEACKRGEREHRAATMVDSLDAAERLLEQGYRALQKLKCEREQ